MINFHDLYEKYAADIYRFSYWLTGDAVEADDMTAETFARALAGSAEIRTATVKAYLLTIARNLYRQRQRQVGRNVDLADSALDQSLSVEAVMDIHLDIEMARNFLQSLPELERTAFILRVVEELPYAEIARLLQISLSAAKVKVHRTRLKLAQVRLDKENNHEHKS